MSCSIGELLGIAIAGGIAFLVNKSLGEPQDLISKLLVLGSMMVAGFLEGSILGFFQWNVLKDKFTKLPRKEWLFYTILIAVLGWILGVLPSLFFALQEESDATIEPSVFENPWIFASLSVGSGLVLGALFGLFQWFSLRKYAKKASRWIIANALGWGLGLGWIYLVASLPQADSPIYLYISVGMLGGILAGLSVGAVTGLFQITMNRKD